MPSLTIPSVPASTLSPGTFIDVVLGAGPAIGAPQGSVLCIAQGITSNLTYQKTVTVSSGAVTALVTGTIAKGTAAATTVWSPASAGEASVYGGAGSEAHRMVLAAMTANPNARVTVAQLAAKSSGGAAVASSCVLAINGTADQGDGGTSGVDGAAFNGSIVITINGKGYTVPFTAGQSTASIVADIVTALNDPECPAYITGSSSISTPAGVYAVRAASGDLTGLTAGAFAIKLTSKCTGARFNGLSILVEIYDSAGAMSYTRAGVGSDNAVSSGATGSGITMGIFKSITANASSPTWTALDVGLEGRFANGTGTETAGEMSTFLAIIRSSRYERIAVPFTYSTEGVSAVTLSSLMAQVATQAGPTEMLFQQVCASSIGGLTTASTGAVAEATARNSKLLNLSWHKNCPTYPGETAADFAASRLGGDAARGGYVVGETENPSTNLCGLQSGSRQAYLPSDRPSAAEIEYALHNGVSPLVPSAINPGFLQASAPSTTYCKDSAGQPDTTCLHLNNVTTPQWIGDLLRVEYPKVFNGCNLIPDEASPTGLRQVRPKDVRDWALALLRANAQQPGFIIDVDALADQVVFAIQGNNRTRLNGRIPVKPAPWLVTTVLQVRGV